MSRVLPGMFVALFVFFGLHTPAAAQELAAANTIPLNSEIEIVANVIENGVASSTPTGTPGAPATSTSTAGAGTPVQNGTLVSFTTTIGNT